VHQIELEMQNEELRQAQETIEESLARYSRILYDFAPVRIISLLTRNGQVLKQHLTVVGQLGIERGRLLQKPFICAS